MAGLLPGEVLDLNRLETFRKRLDGLQYFNAPPEQGGKPIEIKVVNRRPHDKPYGDGAAPDPDGLSLTRMQDPGPEPPWSSRTIRRRPGPGRRGRPRRGPRGWRRSDRRARSTRPPTPCRRSRSPSPRPWALLRSSTRRDRGRRRRPSARASRRPRSRASPA